MNAIQIHPLSDVQSSAIGAGTRIWQYCIIFPNAKIGANCNICAQVLIENDVIVGDDVTIKSGVQLWDGVRIGNGVFIGPNTSFANDLFPRSKKYPENFLVTKVSDGVSIGANATILPGVSIGNNAMIGAGSVVTRDVPANAIIVGNPGVIKGYVGMSNFSQSMDIGSPEGLAIMPLGVGDCALYTLPFVPDMRGSLSVAECGKQIPFQVKRCFWVFDVPSKEVRGEHAHKKLHQYLICVKGSISVVLDDGISRSQVILNKANIGLHIPPMVWGIQYQYSSDAVLLVLASEVYEADDYIRNYDDFLKAIRSYS